MRFRSILLLQILCCAFGYSRVRSEALPVRFTDQAEALGIDVENVTGTTMVYIIESMVGGSAFFDYDDDGDVDLYINNGSRLQGFPEGQHPTNRLYRNDGGRFADVTAQAGVGDTSWSMGCAVADYDNDGDADLYVTNHGRNTLYRNGGEGRFEDASRVTGVGDERFSTGCAFGDYDRDGDVDLYVANYVDFSTEYKATTPCRYRNVKVYCGPIGLLPAPDALYRNDGDGSFTEVTAEAGLAGEEYYGLSAGFSDLDDDGWPDIFVANDATPNMLFQNLGDGTFEDIALMAGVAYDGNGVNQASMGIALGDYDNDGLFDIYVTTFADEFNTLYRNEGDGFFADVSHLSQMALISSSKLSWGAIFLDYDNDGHRDIFVANGHTYPEADLPQIPGSYRQKNFLFANQGDRRFAEVAEQAGPGFAVEKVSRGASAADFDDDGDVDLFVLNLNSKPTLLRNDGGNRNNYLEIRTVGTRSNRDGIGTRIAISAGGHQQYGEVQSGTSYISHNDLRVHFGLGQATQVDSVELRWPSGEVQVLRDVAANQILTVREPE